MCPDEFDGFGSLNLGKSKVISCSGTGTKNKTCSEDELSWLPIEYSEDCGMKMI